MGESTCLLRSFSTPAESSGAAQELQGNPLPVLGQSISFGRFFSENLDWEKWSSFSHNRYVEEAEKYSKPGSVAAMKAYFEALYKRKATEKDTALVQELNAQAGGTFDSKTLEANRADSVVMEESETECTVTTNVQQDKVAAVYQIVDCADANQHTCDIGQSDIEISNAEEAGEMPHTCNDESLHVESCIIVDDSNQFDHVEPHKNIDLHVVEILPDPGAVVQEVLPSPKLSTKTRAAKLLHSLNERKAVADLPPRSRINRKSARVSGENQRLTARSLSLVINLPSDSGETSKTAAAPAQSRSSKNSVPKTKKPVEGSIEKKHLSARSLYMSVNRPSGAGETSKTAIASSVKPRNVINRELKSNAKKPVEGSIEKKHLSARSLYLSVNRPSGAGETSKTATAASVKPRNVINHELKSMKSVGDLVKKRPTTRSLHMSINISSDHGETSKTASVIEHNVKEKNHSNLLNISKDHPVALRTSTKASRGLLNQASENPLSQGRRSERLLNKSLSGGGTANAKLLSISATCSRSNPRPPTTSSSFRFRSEERAVKRKEFLQRMDEIKNKEAGTVRQQRTSKDKIENDHKKLWQSNVFKSKLDEEGRNGGSHSPSNLIRKTSLTKTSNSRTVQDISIPKSRKPPMSTNNSKRITEKGNRTRQLVASLSNITRENASPNIQH